MTKTTLYTIGKTQLERSGHGDSLVQTKVVPLGAYGCDGMPPLFIRSRQAQEYIDSQRIDGVVVPLVLEADGDGVDMIQAERFRQICGEGYDAEHDEEHTKAELTAAAAAYCMAACNQIVYPDMQLPSDQPPMWPFAQAYWKPHRDPVRNLVKAGALIAAEIDRVLRTRNTSQHSWQ